MNPGARVRSLDRSAPRHDQPATWRRRCGRCKAPLTGYDAEVETVLYAADPADAPLAAMGVPVRANRIPVKIVITHQPCGCEYWKAPTR
jgi:hypothetical protein